MKKIFCFIICFMMLFLHASAVSADENYIVSDWAANEVNRANELGLTAEELPADLTGNITRAEFAAVSVKLFETLTGEDANFVECPFTDIKDDDVRIKQAYTLGITMGVSETEFAPDLNITREQLAAMLLRTVILSKYTYNPDLSNDIRGLTPYDDDKEISYYAKEAVYYLSKFGIIKGVDTKRFAPQNTATREHAVLMALRIYNAFDKMKMGKEN